MATARSHSAAIHYDYARLASMNGSVDDGIGPWQAEATTGLVVEHRERLYAR